MTTQAAVKLVVNVTAEDIQQGRRRSCDRCPIALALYRAAEGHDIGSFGVGRFACSGVGTVNHELMNAKLPAVARDFVLDFDVGISVSPISFELLFD